MMKKTLWMATAFVLAVALIGLAGCFNPVQQFQGPGNGKLVVTVDAPGSRTLFPGNIADLIDAYVLSFDGPGTQADVAVDKATGVAEVNLAPGAWEITAKGLIDGEVIAAGSKAVTVVSGQTSNISIILGPIASAETGLFVYDIKAPGGSAISLNIEGIEIITDASGQKVLPAGEYRVILNIEKDNKFSAGKIEALHIYAGLTTRLDYDVSDYEWVSPISTGFDLTDKITAPVKDATAVTGTFDAEQYSASVAWLPADAFFNAATVYKAVVTLTEKPGYGFNGIASDAFSYDGADAVFDAVTGVVTITFPATAAPDPVEININIGFDYGKIDIAGSDGENVIYRIGEPAALNLSINGYDNVNWFVDGKKIGEGNAVTVSAADYNLGNHRVSFIGYRAGISFSQAIPFTVDYEAVIDTTPTTYRSVVAVRSGSNVFLSWRLFLADHEDIGFNVWRNGEKINNEILGPAYTDYLHTGSSSGDYQIEVLIAGQSVAFSEIVQPLANDYLIIPLNKPTFNVLVNGNTYSNAVYNAYDAAPADLTGDGKLDIAMFWLPGNEQDSSQNGVTGQVYIDAYSLDGTKIWGNGKWIQLGPNLRAGNHDTIFSVADFDGSGYAHIITKTAPLTIDTAGNVLGPIDADGNIRKWTKVGNDILDEDGNVVNQANYRYVSGGYVSSGEEYLSIFDGRTGEFLDTIMFPVPRNMMEYSTGDNGGSGNAGRYGVQGNRTNRFTAGVANLDHNPGLTAIIQRGYYSQNSTTISAIDWDGTKLEVRWIFSTNAYTAQAPVPGRATSTSALGSAYTGRYMVYSAGGTQNPRGYNYTGGNWVAGRHGPYANTGGPFPEKAVYPAGLGPSNPYGIPNMWYNDHGNHQIIMADLDGNGIDTIVTGTTAINADGTLRWETFRQHGDAMHLGKHLPDRPGLQLWTVHEISPFGASMIDTRTGEIIWTQSGSADTGRGCAATIDPNIKGSVVWASNGVDSRNPLTGARLAASPAYSGSAIQNFAIYWSGGTSRNLLDGGNGNNAYVVSAIRNGSSFSTSLVKTFTGARSNAGTKQVPMLQADLIGDWREEVIYRDANSTELRVYTTTISTVHSGVWAIPDSGIPTLLDDHNYLMQLSSQHAAYNQPPWPSWYIGANMDPIRSGGSSVPAPVTVSVTPNTLDLLVDDQSNLQVYVGPVSLADKTVTWSSNNTAVATVNASGRVTAVSAGTAIITATSNADAAKSDICTVIVKDPPPPPTTVEFWSWDASTDAAFADLGVEATNATDPFSASGVSLRGGNRVYDGIILQNYIWTGNVPTATGFAPNFGDGPGPMKALPAGAVQDGFTLSRAGYLLSELSSPCLQIGSDMRGRTTSSNAGTNGQIDLSNKKFRITVEYTALKTNTVGDADHPSGAGTSTSNNAQFLFGVIYNGGATSVSATPWTAGTSGAGVFALNNLGQLQTWTREFDTTGLTTAQNNALTNGFINLRVGNSNCGGRAVIHSVKLEVIQ